jgi:hypothetical protein
MKKSTYQKTFKKSSNMISLFFKGVKVKHLTHEKTRYNRTILYLKNPVSIALLKINKKLRFIYAKNL